MKQTVKKILFFLLKLVFAAGILVWLIHSANIKWNDFTHVSAFALISAALCIMAQLALTAARWYCLVRSIGVKLSLWEAYSLTMQGSFFSLFIPAGAVGGDIVKAGIVVKRSPSGSKFNGAFSIFADRLIGLIALMLSTIFGIILFLPEILHEWSGELRTMLLLLLCCCTGAMLAALAVFFHDILYRIGWIRKLLDIGDKYSKGAFTNAANAVSAYRKSWRLVLLWIAISVFVAFPFLAGSVVCLAKGLPDVENEANLQTMYFASNCSQTVGVLPLTPGGIGTRDAVCSALLRVNGFSMKNARLVPLLYTGVLILVSLTGSIFFVFDKTGK